MCRCAGVSPLGVLLTKISEGWQQDSVEEYVGRILRNTTELGNLRKELDECSEYAEQIKKSMGEEFFEAIFL